jgi:hypothetical protein
MQADLTVAICVDSRPGLREHAVHQPETSLAEKLTAMYYKLQKKATSLKLIGRNISHHLTQVNLQVDVGITGFVGF